MITTSELVSPTIELMSKLDRRLKPFEDNGALTFVFRPNFPPHKEEEVVEVNAYKDDDNTEYTSANICTSLTANISLNTRKMAILLNHGSFNPVHAHHVAMMQEAKIVFENSGYAVCLGIMAIAPRDRIIH